MTEYTRTIPCLHGLDRLKAGLRTLFRVVAPGSPKREASWTVFPLAFLLAIEPAGARAQEVLVPDPGLNAAIREALQKPAGPLTGADLLSLTFLSAGGRNISNVAGLEFARNLSILDLDNNFLTNFPIADALTNLTILDLFNNDLTSFLLTNALSRLTILDLGFNSLARCSLPSGLTNLDTLFLEGNSLANFIPPEGLTRLTQLDLSRNQLNNLTLPPDVTGLAFILVNDNPLDTFVLSETLAAMNLAGTVATLRNEGVQVFTYPLTVQLVRPRRLTGAFQFGLTGPPGVYAVLASVDLVEWSQAGVASNTLGSVSFVDVTTHEVSTKFYRAQRFNPPTNTVFVPSNLSTMGSPTNEPDRASEGGPPTTVTLTRGFRAFPRKSGGL